MLSIIDDAASTPFPLLFLSDALKRKELYIGIVVKMIVLPLVGGHVLFALGWPTDVVVSMTVIMSLPVMTVVPMIAASRWANGPMIVAGR